LGLGKCLEGKLIEIMSGKYLLRENVIRARYTLARSGAASFLGRTERSEGRHQKDRVESRMKLLKK